MTVQIKRCSHPGCWWEKHIGRFITVLYTDHHGHWTRDTNKRKGAYPFLQWVAVEDTSPTFNGNN